MKIIKKSRGEISHDVYFTSCVDYNTKGVEEAVERLFCQLQVEKTIKPSHKILLKPNLLSKSSPDKAITTHPEVVRVVIRALVKRGISKENITIADSAGGLYNTKQTVALYQGCKLTGMAQEEQVSLYTKCESEIVKTSGQGGDAAQVAKEFTIIKPALEADVIINLPKFKTHVMTGLTAGLKNMFGVVPGLDKSQWHMQFPERDPFGHMLVDLYQLIPPTFTILDGVLAMEGDGPGSGTPRCLGVLMASESPLHMDLAVAHMMSLPAMAVPYLKVANQRGLCPEKIDLSNIKGETELFRPIPQWKLAKSYENGGEGSTSFMAMLPSFLEPMGRKIEASLAPRPIVIPKICVGCEKCAEICSKDAITFSKKKAFIEKKKCIRCFCCHEVCPVKAIDVKKSPLSGK